MFRKADLSFKAKEMKNFQFKQYEFEVLDVSPQMRVAVRSAWAKKVQDGKCDNFISNMENLIKKVAQVPLNYKKSFRASFLVFPEGKEFGEVLGLPIEQGMCEASVALDKNYPLALMVDENWFENGFGKELSFQQQVGLIHELGHIVHGAYFRNMGCMGEGFAELLPHYLMGLENQKHQQKIFALTDENLQTLDFIHQNGMFALEPPNGANTQELKSYMSVYLWMLGYVKRLEDKYHLDRFEATCKMLQNFAEFDKQSWQNKMTATAALVDMAPSEMLQTKALQLEGKKYFADMWGRSNFWERNMKKERL